MAGSSAGSGAAAARTAGVVIPALNEEASVGRVIADLRRVTSGIPEFELKAVVVADNGSTDRTADAAAQAGALVCYVPKRGYGRACKAAIRTLSELDQPPDLIIFMDGDYADDAADLPQLLKPIYKGADLVIGSRLSGQRSSGSMTIPQIFGNRLAVFLIRILYGMRFTDLGPFRIIRRAALEQLNMQDDTFGWTVEMQIKAAKLSLTCVEVPVRYRPRIGVSKVSGTVKGTILAGYRILWTVFRYL